MKPEKTAKTQRDKKRDKWGVKAKRRKDRRAKAKRREFEAQGWK